jgi:hypothetical protein
MGTPVLQYPGNHACAGAEFAAERLSGMSGQTVNPGGEALHAKNPLLNYLKRAVKEVFYGRAKL